MKTDRLMGIAAYLMNNGRTSAQWLAEIFEVSTRTIIRDMETLDMAGIPVQSFCGANGGYQLAEGYAPNGSVVTAHDYAKILTALQAYASGYDDGSVHGTLEKLKTLARDNEFHVSMDLSAAREDGLVNGYLRLLADAITKMKKVRFRYTNGYGETKEITVSPVKLQYKWYNWYLSAFCDHHEGEGLFKLVRMEELSLTDEAFSDAPGQHGCVKAERPVRNMNVRLRCRAHIRAKCREYLHGEVVREYENGDFEYAFTAPAHETFWFGVVLSFGCNAVVLEPAELAARITDTCREVLRLYEGNNKT